MFMNIGFENTKNATVCKPIETRWAAIFINIRLFDVFAAIFAKAKIKSKP
jgi:hypothetical protein